MSAAVLHLKPFAPIPSAELADDAMRHLMIRPLALVLQNRYGEREHFETDRSNVAFARLHTAATVGESVASLIHGDLAATPDSLGALNAYLRTGRAMGRMKLPFDRLPISGTHRYAWASFCEYLGLVFR